MAGQHNGTFPEKLSPFLRRKLAEASSTATQDATVVRLLSLQYLYDQDEKTIREGERRRHYEAEIHPQFDGEPVAGVERLYRRSILIEPTTVCAAHCRWCLRGQYPTWHLTQPELLRAVCYIAKAPENAEVREVLITGGDPFMDLNQLEFLLNALRETAQQVRIYRVGTRVPLQAPERVGERMLALLRNNRDRLEMGIHINHPAELFPEVRDALAAIRETGVTIYNQSVLLRQLNDDPAVLVDLADALRELRIEMHYLFHCAPIRGMRHHRTTVSRGLKLIRSLTASGAISGRSKPALTLLTDVGKVTLYDGSILTREGTRILLQTDYLLDDRLSYNPQWQLPSSAQVDSRGRLQVWYEDGGE